MKSLNLILIGLISFSLLFLTSCEKKDEIIEALSNSEAKQIIESSLQANTAGFTKEVEDISELSIEDLTIDIQCDSSYMDSFTRHHQNVAGESNYNVSWDYNMACNSINDVNIPQSLSLSATSTGTYQGLKISFDDIASGSLEVIGLQPSSSTLQFAGNYSRVGVQEIIAINTRTINSSLKLSFSNIVVDKELMEIVSGDASFSLTGANSSNENFAFNGTIQFTGNRTATVILNGEAYEIDLN